jgi:hypothetical protein
MLVFYGTRRFITLLTVTCHLSQHVSSRYFPTYFLKSSLIVGTPEMSERSLPFRLSDKLFQAYYMHRPSNSLRFDHPNNTIWAQSSFTIFAGCNRSSVACNWKDMQCLLGERDTQVYILSVLVQSGTTGSAVAVQSEMATWQAQSEQNVFCVSINKVCRTSSQSISHVMAYIRLVYCFFDAVCFVSHTNKSDRQLRVRWRWAPLKVLAGQHSPPFSCSCIVIPKWSISCSVYWTKLANCMASSVSWPYTDGIFVTI